MTLGEVEEELHRGRGPIWVVFTADGKYAYAEKGHEDTCIKVDVAKAVVEGS